VGCFVFSLESAEYHTELQKVHTVFKTVTSSTYRRSVTKLAVIVDSIDTTRRTTSQQDSLKRQSVMPFSARCWVSQKLLVRAIQSEYRPIQIRPF